MKPYEVAALVGIHENTVRSWSTNEYKQYLNHAAQGGGGRRRDFDQRDVQIIGFIHSLKEKNTHPEEIHAALKQLQANDWQDLPPLEQGPTPVASFPVVPQIAADMSLQAERQRWAQDIARLEQRIERLEHELTDERDKREELIAQLAKAKTMLDLYESGRLLPPKPE